MGHSAWDCINCVYFASFLASASSAAPPLRAEVVAKLERATVSATVTSQVMQRTERHGINVRPSGFLPSDLSMPWGTLIEWIPARLSEAPPDQVIQARMPSIPARTQTT